MLPKEKKRAVWSLAIGAVMSAALFGAFNWRAHLADSQALRLDAMPHSSPTPKVLSDRDFVPESDLPGHWVVDTPSASDLLRTKAAGERSDGQTFALLTMAICAVPFVWYFLLDRLREVVAAILGRDQHS